MKSNTHQARVLRSVLSLPPYHFHAPLNVFRSSPRFSFWDFRLLTLWVLMFTLLKIIFEHQESLRLSQEQIEFGYRVWDFCIFFASLCRASRESSVFVKLCKLLVNDKNLLIVNGKFFNFLVCIYITSQERRATRINMIQFPSLYRSSGATETAAKSLEFGEKTGTERSRVIFFNKFDLHFGFSECDSND